MTFQFSCIEFPRAPRRTKRLDLDDFFLEPRGLGKGKKGGGRKGERCEGEGKGLRNTCWSQVRLLLQSEFQLRDDTQDYRCRSNDYR